MKAFVLRLSLLITSSILYHPKSEVALLFVVLVRSLVGS